MASQVTVAELRGYASIPSTVSDATVQLFIDQAYLIIDENLANSGYSTSRLKMIELNLAAHFSVLTNEKGGLTFLQVGESAERYQLGTEGAVGLDTTRYGKQIALLDTGNLLSILFSSPIKAQFEVYG